MQALPHVTDTQTSVTCHKSLCTKSCALLRVNPGVWTNSLKFHQGLPDNCGAFKFGNTPMSALHNAFVLYASTSLTLAPRVCSCSCILWSGSSSTLSSCSGRHTSNSTSFLAPGPQYLLPQKQSPAWRRRPAENTSATLCGSASPLSSSRSMS